MKKLLLLAFLIGSVAVAGLTPLSFPGGTLTGPLILTPGTTTSAPLTIPAGSLLSSPASGSIEYDGTNLYYTNATPTRFSLLSGTTSSANTPNTIVLRDGSGNFAAGVMTGSASLNVLKAGDTMSGTLDMGANKITTSYVPVAATDLVNKTYADAISGSLSWKQAVEVATTGALPSYVYANGASGVGATITASVNGALPAQDGIILIVNDRLLVKDETGGNLPYNGLYTVTAVGSGAAKFVLTRATDSDQAAELLQATVQTSPDGTTQAGFAYRQSTAGPLTVGTSSLSFVNILIGTSYVFTNGTKLSGSTVSADVDNSTIDITGTSLEVKSGGITNTQINASAGIVDTKLATISTASKVSNSATTATSANTGSAIVARDGSGNFSAGTITASLTGHASLDLPLTGGTLTGQLLLPASTTASSTAPLKLAVGTLMTTAASGSIEYNGTSLFYTDATPTRNRLAIAGGALTASKNVVTDSSGNLATATTTSTEAGYLAGVTVTNGGVIYGNGTNMVNTGAGLSAQVLSSVGAGAPTWITPTSANTASTIVARDGSGNFAAGTITAALTGNVTGSASLNVLKAGDTMTGQLVLPASTTSNATAPIKINTGVLQSTPQAGSIEYDGTSLYYTNSGATRKTVTVSTDLSSYLPLVGGTLTGQLVLPASTTSSNTAPLKLATGVLQSVPQSGAIEYDGTNLYYTTAAAARNTIFTTMGGTLLATLTGRASTTSPSTAPIKLPTGVLMSTPEAGAIEYDGTNLFFTDAGAARRAITTIDVCEIVVGDPGAGASALADDDDTPTVCSNDTSRTMTITAVHCYAPTGSPTVTPIITGGSGTSILSGALTCSSTAGGAAGSLNGTPTQTAGQTIDGNITTAGGTAKYLVIRITRSL